MYCSIECIYCGHKWKQHIYTHGSAKDLKCPKCKDVTLKITESEKNNIDYYKDAPPFQPKKVEDDEFYY